MASKKKRLFLALDNSLGKLFLSVVPPKGTPTVKTTCSCGDPACDYNSDGGTSGGGFGDGYVHFFCEDGLRRAGIKLRAGQVVEVTLSKVAR